MVVVKKKSTMQTLPHGFVCDCITLLIHEAKRWKIIKFFQNLSVTECGLPLQVAVSQLYFY
jgi:hypothetical protein